MQLITDKIEQLLVQFGKYIASKERNDFIQGDKTEIYDADLANFRDINNLANDYDVSNINLIQKTDNTMRIDYDGV
jgi:hypothetical protein